MNDANKSRFERENEQNFKRFSLAVQLIYITVMVFAFNTGLLGGMLIFISSFLVRFIAYKAPFFLITILNKLVSPRDLSSVALFIQNYSGISTPNPGAIFGCQKRALSTTYGTFFDHCVVYPSLKTASFCAKPVKLRSP